MSGWLDPSSTEQVSRSKGSDQRAEDCGALPSDLSHTAAAHAPSSAKNPGQLIVRAPDGSEADYRAGVFLAREAHENTVFGDIPFSEAKALAIFERALKQPDRFGLLYAAPPSSERLAEDGLYGFASVQAGEHFLGKGALIATVQTLSLSRRLSGTLLAGRVALRLVKALRHWAQSRNCEHLLVHVTHGVEPQAADRFFRRCGLKTVGGNYWQYEEAF